MASEQDDKMDALRRGFYSRFWKDIAEQQATPETSERSSTMASEELTAEVLERLERLAEDQPTVWIKASTLRDVLLAFAERHSPTDELRELLGAAWEAYEAMREPDGEWKHVRENKAMVRLRLAAAEFDKKGERDG